MNKSLLIAALLLLVVEVSTDNPAYNENANAAALESKIRIYQ
jgi:hypothetical protein